MTHELSFIFSAVALLATPGPTNTLLATSASAFGLRASLVLLSAELFGYLIAISLLIVVGGPLVADEPAFGFALRIAAGLYLLFVAWRLWTEGEPKFGPARAVSFTRVFITTLLNPKALIFAFTLIPGGAEGSIGLSLPWLAVLAPLIGAVGLCWIVAGAAVRGGEVGQINSRVVCRTGAIVLAVFASLLGGSAIATGWS